MRILFCILSLIIISGCASSYQNSVVKTPANGRIEYQEYLNSDSEFGNVLVYYSCDPKEKNLAILVAGINDKLLHNIPYGSNVITLDTSHSSIPFETFTSDRTLFTLPVNYTDARYLMASFFMTNEISLHFSKVNAVFKPYYRNKDSLKEFVTNCFVNNKETALYKKNQLEINNNSKQDSNVSEKVAISKRDLRFI